MPPVDDRALLRSLQELRAAKGWPGVGQVSRSPKHDVGVRDAASEPVDDPEKRHLLLALTRTRQLRVKGERNLSVAHEIDEQARLIRSVQRGMTGVSVAWEMLLAQSGLPREVGEATRIRSFRRGVLTIQVRDASTKYNLSRFLRSGGEARLAKLAPVALTKVRLVM